MYTYRERERCRYIYIYIYIYIHLHTHVVQRYALSSYALACALQIPADGLPLKIRDPAITMIV